MDLNINHHLLSFSLLLNLSFTNKFWGEYYFLEINPVGQISGYSERCFLNFEREFIENLIKIDNGEIINC